MTERIPFSYLLAIAWTGIAASLLKVLLGASIVLRPGAASDIVHLGAIEALVFVVAVLGVLGVHGRDVPLAASLGIRATHPGLAVLGVALGFVVHYPAESLDALFQQFVPTPPDRLAGRMALLSAGSPVQLALVLLVVACVGPLVEELFFRGALYGSLRRGHSLWGATLATAACFVVGHLDFYLWPALTIVAVVMSYLRAASGSLLPPLAMHVAFNAVTELALVTGQVPVSSVEIQSHLELYPAIGGWIVTLGLLFAVQYVASRSPDARRGRAEDAE